MIKVDITKCTNYECKEKLTCLRYTSQASQYQQSYSLFNIENKAKCDMKLDNSKHINTKTK